GGLVVSALFRSCRDAGGVPNLDSERAIIERSLAGLGVDTQNVNLFGVDEIEGANPHGIGTARGQLGSVHGGHAIERGLPGLRETGGTEAEKGSYHCKKTAQTHLAIVPLPG